MQIEPSSQTADCGECTQLPDVLSQPSNVQALLSLQSLAEPGAHAPLAQVSSKVHKLPSSHALVLLVNTQPLVGEHVSSVHTLLSSQSWL